MNMISVWNLSPDKFGYIPSKINIAQPGDTLDTLVRKLPGGAYTTLRTYHGNKVIGFNKHLARLVESAKLSGKPVALSQDNFRKVVRGIVDAISKDYEGDLRIRIILDLEFHLGELFLVIGRLYLLPAKFYQEGVRVTTCKVTREKPEAKLTGFIGRANKVRANIPVEYNESLILDDKNQILEGLTSNFFASSKGQLITPAKDILLGTTRYLVLDVAKKNKIPIKYSKISISEIKNIDGAFLTSASRGILPIQSINQDIIGTGSPDQLTAFLMKKYSERILQELESI